MQTPPPSSNVSDICCNSLLCELQDYMFFKQTIDDACKYVSHGDKRVSKEGDKHGDKRVSKEGDNKHPLKEDNRSIYKPHQKDSLFWCYYMLMYGLNACETVGTNRFIIEKNEKIKLVELVRANKLALKFHKMAPISSIEADLTSSEAISISTFFAICVASNISLIYINKTNKTWLKVLIEEIKEERPDTVNVLYRSEISHRFECETNVDSSIINATENTHFKLFSMNKPIQALSSYKSAELLEICTKVGIDIYLESGTGTGTGTGTSKTHSKQQLYNAHKLKLVNH